MTKTRKRLWTGLFIMALLSPLGILLPEVLNSGGAWGEWGADTLGKLLGFVPEGLKKYTGIWKAPVPDYNAGGEGSSTTVRLISYAGSGLLGIVLVGLVMYLISKKIRGNNGE
jgi:hypothetical protein